MRYIYLVIQFLFLVLVAFSQDTFDERYNTGVFADYGAAQALVPMEDGYLIGGWIDTSAYHPQLPFYLKTDKQGNTEWFNIYNFTGISGDISDMVAVGDGTFIGVGSGSVSTPVPDYYSVQMQISKIDREGNVIWYFDYGLLDDSSEHGRSIDALPDGNFLITGDQTNFISLLLKISSDGDVIWEKKHFGSNFNGLETVVYDDGTVIVMNSANIMKVDPDGNEVWRLSIGSPLRGISPTNDNGVIACQSISGGISRIIKITNNGEIIWTMDYPIGIPTDVFYESDESMIIGGYQELAKVNSLGDIEWSVTYRDTSSDWNSLSKSEIQRTKDNGYVFCGFDEGRIALIKTNCKGEQGHDDDCFDFEEEDEVFLYPNPTNECLNIVLVDSVESLKVRIFDISGKLIHSEYLKERNLIQYNVSHLAKGVYIVSLVSESGEIQDSKRVLVR